MGLDMYFEARKYVSSYSKDPVTLKLAQSVREVLEIEDEGITLCDISLNVGQLRKANAIHNWIIQNIASGVDECQDIYLEIKQIIKLREICDNVLHMIDVEEENPDLYGLEERAEIHGLQTKSGFFFGSLDYDIWYAKDLKETIDIMDRFLKLHESENYAYDFYYRASW